MAGDRYVPVVVVMLEADYQKLCSFVVDPTELPASIRELQASHGWTPEMLLLGRILSEAAALV